MIWKRSKGFCAGFCLVMLTACGGSAVGNGGNVGTGSAPVVEVEDPNYIALDERGAVASVPLSYVVLQGETPSTASDSSLTYATGAVSGGVLDGLDLDSASFENLGEGEYSRVFRISGANSAFGVVGLETQSADLPTSGTLTQLNAGWVAVTASTDGETYTLQGDAQLTATWASNRVRGEFTNLSGRTALDSAVTNVGNISLANAVISGSRMSGGTVTGTGIFSSLDDNSDTTGSQGVFFGPQAEEIGGVLIIRDDSVDVTGAYQSD